MAGKAYTVIQMNINSVDLKVKKILLQFSIWYVSDKENVPTC